MLLYASVTVKWRVLVIQQSMSMSVGVMVKPPGVPAVMVMSVVLVIVLPMAAASIVATPACAPEVAMAVAVPPEVVVPERKASTYTRVSVPPVTVYPATVTLIVCGPSLRVFVITFST